ncbi:MAG TPA: cysteine desulfurase NifS [Candidatus Wallbacteria bacterium]|nr:cysteine desulfurase NifS [Candidatus Wallbacteria bacterium]
MNKAIYVDNNATTPIAPEVYHEMIPYLTQYYGNPSSIHTFGGQLASKIDEARQKVADLLGALATEIVFTSCGTESDNAAILGILSSNPSKKHIITTKVEHPAILNLCQHLEKNGYDVTYLSVDRSGALSLDELQKSMRPDTAIVSVMYANNETGVIFPIEQIGRIVKSRGSMFHVDAVQAVGKIPIDLSKSSIDLLSLSGHKLHAPKGVGVLYIRRGTMIRPFIIGGHQERGRRAGTENIASICALGKAAELAHKNIADENNIVRKMRDRLEKGLLERIPYTFVNGDTINRLPNTTNISFEYIEGESILLLLDQHGICASSGSACTSGSLQPSHVLRSMGVPFTAAHGSVRFSLSRYNNDSEIDKILEVMPAIISKLRAISPYTPKAK